MTLKLLFLLLLLVLCQPLRADDLSDKIEVRKLYIGLSENANSEWLKKELTRDWRRGAVKLTGRDLARAEGLNDMVKEINTFRPGWVECPIGTKAPALRFGNGGKWITVDPRAFRYSSLPLKAVVWYCEDSCNEGYWRCDYPGNGYTFTHILYRPRPPYLRPEDEWEATTLTTEQHKWGE